MGKKQNNKKLKKALITKAIGCTTQEVIEEYGINGDEFVLQKRRTSTKSYPPDLTALKLLLCDDDYNEFENMSDEDLAREKKKLMKLLKEEE